MAVAFGSAIPFAIALLFFSEDPSEPLLYAFILLLCRSGITLSFGQVFVVNIDAFPPDLLTTALAITNGAARLISLSCPVFAELKYGDNNNVQIYGLIGMLIIGTLCSLSIYEVNKVQI